MLDFFSEIGAVEMQTQSIAAALACLALLYSLMPRLPPGLPRLLLLLPCLPVFAWVPFSTRHHSLRAILSFSFLWTCPSKLLLLSWGLSPDYPASGFLYFLVTTVLPLRVRAPSSAHTIQGADLFPHILKFFLFFAVINASQYRDRLSLWAIHALYCLLVFLGLQWVLGLSAKLAVVLLGVETYPHFDNPFLAASLSEFWSRRWNLVATFMLRETVYAPILRHLSPGQQQDTAKHTFEMQKSRRKAGNNAGMSKEKMQAPSSSNKTIQMTGSQANSTSKHRKLQQVSSVGEWHDTCHMGGHHVLRSTRVSYSFGGCSTTRASHRLEVTKASCHSLYLRIHILFCSLAFYATHYSSRIRFTDYSRVSSYAECDTSFIQKALSS